MTKKDYERAATLVQSAHEIAKTPEEQRTANRMAQMFVLFFSHETRFDEARFLSACKPGANVKARA